MAFQSAQPAWKPICKLMTQRGLRLRQGLVAKQGLKAKGFNSCLCLRAAHQAAMQCLPVPGQGPEPQLRKALANFWMMRISPSQGKFSATYIITANVTAWSSGLKWLEHQSPEGPLICIQEHRLLPVPGQEDKIGQARKKLQVLAYQGHFGHALSTIRESTSVGVAILYKPYQCIKPGEEIVPGRAILVEWYTRALGRINVVSLYGFCAGQGAASCAQVSISKDKLLTKVLSYLEDRGCPYAVGGDFKLEPAAVTRVLSIGGFAACVTCNSSCPHTLDYFVVSKVLGPLAVVEVMEYTSLAPHKPVRLRLALGERGQKVTKLISPGRSSPRPVVGPANLVSLSYGKVVGRICWHRQEALTQQWRPPTSNWTAWLLLWLIGMTGL